MARSPFHFRTVCALVALGVLATLFARAGFWQLDRARQRDATAREITLAAKQPPVALNDHDSTKDLPAWRPATATGQWLHAYTILIENRNYQGQPGYWVATPLALSKQLAVTVLRGWLPRDRVIDTIHHQGADQVDPALLEHLAKPTGTQTIEGELFPHVPRVFELWSWSTTGSTSLPEHLDQTHTTPIVVQNLAVSDYQRATGLILLPTVLAQDKGSDVLLVQEWEHPSTDSSINKGYALQWFGFFAIAAIAWIALLWRGLRTVLEKEGT